MSDENQKAKILVVDDAIIIATDLRNRVSELGYTALGPVTHGEAALRAVEKERPDLILMDIILGDGMDGIEAARIIRERFDIPVIFITAYAEEERLNQAKLSRPFGYIIKPFRERDLKITIEMALYLAKVEAERKQAEESLRVFQQIVDSSPDAMSFVDRNYVYRTVNDAYLQRYGLPREKIVGRTVAEIMGQRVFNEVIKPRFDNCLAGETVIYEDWFDYGPRGRKCMEVTYAPCRDHASKIMGVAASIRDITERKQAEEALRESEERYRQILTEAPNSIVVVQDGKFVYANPCAAKLRGYDSPEELIGVPSTDFIAEEFQIKMVSRLKNIEAGKKNEPIELRILSKNGTTSWLESESIPTRFNDRPAAIIISNDITRRKAAEESLRKREALLSAVLEQMPMAVMVYDSEGRIILDNPANRFFMPDGNIPARDPKRRHRWHAVDADGRPLPPERFPGVRALRGEVVNPGVEFLFTADDGREIWTYVTAVPFRTAKDETAGVIGVAQDITERKRTEKEMEVVRAQLSSAVEMAHLGPWEYDVANDLFTFNDHFYKIFRTSAGEVGGYTMSSAEYATRFVHPDDRALVGEEVQRAIEAIDGKLTRKLDHRIVRADGTTGHISVQFSIVKDAQGKTIKTFGVNQDITELKRAEAVLRDQRDALNKVFESVPFILILVDRDSRVEQINRAGAIFAGRPRSDLLGLLCGDLFGCVNSFGGLGCGRNAECGDCPVGRRIAHTMLTGEAFYNQEGKLTIETGDGKDTLDLLISTARLRLGDEDKVLVVLADVTEQKRLEDQLRQALKMEAVGTLAGGIAHDFNNLTQAVIGYAQLLLLDKDEKSQEYRDLTAIYRAGERAAQLIRQLMAFSRKMEADRRPINLNQVVSDTESLLERTIPKMIDLHLELGKDLWPINADAVQMEQILLNLGVNAADAMPDGGSLFIRTSNIFIDEDFCRSRPEFHPGQYVLFTVSDTGQGMDQDTRQKIFDPFFTTKEQGKGTGLGLASVYGIVKSHGGHIRCESELGQGATFLIYLPAIGLADSASNGGDAPDLPSGADETILLVDDEAAVLELTGKILTRFGYRVIAAECGEAALKIFRERKDEIDLVVLDLNMPGMGGRKCLEEMLLIDPEARVAMSSGYSAAAKVSSLLESGAVGFIAKPYHIEGLLSKIREILDETA